MLASHQEDCHLGEGSLAPYMRESRLQKGYWKAAQRNIFQGWAAAGQEKNSRRTAILVCQNKKESRRYRSPNKTKTKQTQNSTDISRQQNTFIEAVKIS